MKDLIHDFYSRLTDFILDNINLKFSTILEAGCSQGELTIPFAKKVRKFIQNLNLIAFDLSGGPYSNSLKILKS